MKKKWTALFSVKKLNFILLSKKKISGKEALVFFTMDPGTSEKVKIKSKPITTSAFKNCRRLLHWGPCFALSIIFLISFMSVTCTLMWWPVNTMGGLLNLLVFMMWDTLTLYNYFMAVFNGPGFVPYGWRPVMYFSYYLVFLFLLFLFIFSS